MPPVPVVVEKIVVQFVASADVWIWNALPYAASHCRTTWLIDAVAPRSTWSHCGSLKALDQRVPVLPSTALDAGNVAFSSEEAVAVLPCDSSVGAARAVTAVVTRSPAARVSAAATAVPTIRVRPGRTALLAAVTTWPNERGRKAGCMTSPW